MVGIGNNIIVKYKKDLCQSQTKLGIITISPSFLSNGKTEYQEIICNGHIKIFDNNFSQNHLIIQSTKNSVSEDFISYNLQQDLIPEIFLSRHIYNNNLSPQINRLYSSTLIWANARDQKNNIPISMYWIKTNVNEKLPKNRKGILSVYGAYGQKEDSYKLDPIALSIINQGFVYCMVHVRGSGFLDSSWYKQGKGLNKWNSINDLVDACEFLVNKCVLSKDKVGLLSTSAGGVIAGATLNIRPDLFKSMLLFSPFINPLGNLLNTKDPFSKTETFEWGDPIHNFSVRNYISSYSPLQNVIKLRNNCTPPVIITLGGAQDVYVPEADLHLWNNLLNNHGFASHLFIDSRAGHGGLDNGHFSLLSKILCSFMNIINQG